MMLMTNVLESGAGLLQSVQAVARSMPEPVGAEFLRVDQGVNFGLPLDVALAQMSARIESKDLAMLVGAVEIHRQMGGSLATILRSVAETMHERVKLSERVRVLTVQSRVSGYIITALPIGVALLLLVLVPSYMEPLFSNVIGYLALTLALVMLATAYFLMGRITRIDI
jgi:tight adherence protein B